MENNWRAALAQDSRHKIVNRIMDTLQKHMPFSGEDGTAELWKIAHRFEEKIFCAAQNQHDYLRKISLKMLTLETRTQTAGTLPNNANAAIQNPGSSIDSGVTVQHSSRNQGQPMPGLGQTQSWQSAQPGMSGVGTASATSLVSSLTSGSSIPQQASLLNSTGQLSANSGSSLSVNTNGQALSQQNVQVATNGPSLAQTMQSQNALLNHSHRGQMTRQQQQQPQSQPQPQPQPQGQSQAQPQAQVQAQVQSQAQQPLTQHLGGVPQSGTMLQQSVQLQQQSIQQQQMQQSQPIQQQQLQQQQQQQQLPAQVQGQPQQLQAQQMRLQAAAMLKPKFSQQQQVIQPQPSSLLQQTGLPQPLAGLQQQSLLPPQQQQQPSLSGLQPLQQNNVQASQQILQQMQAKVAAQQQQQQQQASSLMSLIGQPLQPPPQSQTASAISSSTSQQSALLSQQQSSQQQQQVGSMQQDQQQRLSQPGMQQPASSMEQQKQRLSQIQQSTTLDSSAINGQGQAGITDTQEIVWTKMQALKDKYLQDMKDLYTMLANRSLQPMPQEQLDKLSHYKTVLQRMIPYLLAPRGSLPKEFKIDKVEAFEKQIMSIMDTFKRRKQVPQQQTMQQQAPPQVPPSASLGGQVPGVQQQVHQLSQSMQQDKGVQQTHQMSTPGSNMTDLASNSSNNSLSMVQSNVSVLPQGISSVAQSSSLGGTGTNTLHQSNILNALQPNMNTIQQQQQPQQQPNQQVLQNELPQALHLKHLQQRQQFQQQQYMQQQQQKQPQPVILPVPQMMADAHSENKVTKQPPAPVMKQMFSNQQHPQRLLVHLHQQQQQPKPSFSQPTSSPQMSSPPQMSPQSDFQTIGGSGLQVSKIGTPSQAATPPFMIPSPSPMLEDPELKPLTPAASAGTAVGGPAATPNNGLLAAVSTPGISVSPLLDIASSPLNANIQDRAPSYHPGDDRQIASEPPLERLVKAINSVSQRVLASAVGDMNAVISLLDMLGGSAPGSQSRAAVGEDLAQVTKCKSQARVLSLTEGSAINKKAKRRIDSMALSIVSSIGSVTNSLHRLNGLDGDTESTATSRIKRAKIEIRRSLVDEINDVNEQLIDTHVEIDDDGIEEAAAEGKDGVVVLCAYNAIAMSPNVAFRSRLFHMVAISPLRLLIPSQYPDCSPIVMANEFTPDYNHPVSRTARDDFARSVRCIPQPVSLADMVRAWDSSARNAVVEAATLQGGGCFNSSFGCWESCVS